MGCNRLTTQRELEHIRETCQAMVAVENAPDRSPHHLTRTRAQELARLTQTLAQRDDSHRQAFAQAQRCAAQALSYRQLARESRQQAVRAQRQADQATAQARKAELQRAADAAKRQAEEAERRHREAEQRRRRAMGRVAESLGERTRVEAERSESVARLYESYIAEERQLHSELYKSQPDLLDRLRDLPDIPRPSQAPEPAAGEVDVNQLDAVQRMEWESTVAEVRDAQQQEVRSYEAAKGARQHAQELRHQVDATTDAAAKVALRHRADEASSLATDAEHRYRVQKARAQRARDHLARVRARFRAAQGRPSVGAPEPLTDWAELGLSRDDGRSEDMASDQPYRDFDSADATSGIEKGYREREIALKRFEEHVRDFAHSRTDGSRLPRANEWRPYRFAIQDVIFNLVVMRHAKELDAIEVDVFLTAEVPGYAPLSGARAAALMILSEAFRVGVPMRIRFTCTVESGAIPRSLLVLAATNGVDLPEPERGVIEPEYGSRLYAALTGFPDYLMARISELSDSGLLSIDRACYMIHHGVWTVPEVEGIIASCSYPDLILAGDVAPEQGHLYRYVQTHARAAVMGGHLDRALNQRHFDMQQDRETIGQDGEDDERNIHITTEPEWFARSYVCSEEDVPLPRWPARQSDGATQEKDWISLRAGEPLIALLRPRNLAGLRRQLGSDLESAAQRLGKEPKPAYIAVVVPFDWWDMAAEERLQVEEYAARKSSDVGMPGRLLILVCPETAYSMDADAQRKLARSRVLRD